MQMNVGDTKIPDVKIVKPEIFKDDRGFFTEVYRADQCKELGLPYGFVQFNHSGSVKNTVRGLHFQWEPPNGQAHAGYTRDGIPGGGRYSQRLDSHRRVDAGILRPRLRVWGEACGGVLFPVVSSQMPEDAWFPYSCGACGANFSWQFP